MNNKIKSILLLTIIIVISSYQGCILEDFDTIPINIPVSLPVFLIDDGSHSSITSEAAFCLDSNEIYLDYRGKIREMTLVEVAFRFTDTAPADISGDMRFILRKVDVTGDILLDHAVNGFTPGTYLIPESPFVLDLSGDDLELMNEFLAANGTCFYGFVGIDNLSPAGPKVLKGFVDMLFKAETEF